MDETLERQLLETAVNLLMNQLHDAGMGIVDTSPNKDGSLSHLSLSDLRMMKRELVTLARTAGGLR